MWCLIIIKICTLIVSGAIWLPFKFGVDQTSDGWEMIVLVNSRQTALDFFYSPGWLAAAHELSDCLDFSPRDSLTLYLRALQVWWRSLNRWSISEFCQFKIGRLVLENSPCISASTNLLSDGQKISQRDSWVPYLLALQISFRSDSGWLRSDYFHIKLGRLGFCGDPPCSDDMY